jgi:AcrR family transcriptional regulator
MAAMTEATTDLEGPRRRLMQGFTAAVAERGYAATTIADIVAAARVSKRTFYEHFADKEDCLLATYQLACDRLIELIRQAAPGPGVPWRDGVRAVAHAYLSALDELPSAHRTLLLEIQAAGPRAFRLRTRMQSRFAELMRELVEEGHTHEPQIRPLTPALALAVVGGINELLLHTVDPYTGEGSDRPFTSLTDTVADFTTAVIGHHGQ